MQDQLYNGGGIGSYLGSIPASAKYLLGAMRGRGDEINQLPSLMDEEPQSLKTEKLANALMSSGAGKSITGDRNIDPRVRAMLLSKMLNRGSSPAIGSASFGEQQ